MEELLTEITKITLQEKLRIHLDTIIYFFASSNDFTRRKKQQWIKNGKTLTADESQKQK